MRGSVLFIVLLGAMASWACHERIIVYPPPPIPPDTTLPQTNPVAPPKGTEPIRIETILPAKTPPTFSRFDVGMFNFRQGNYLEAIQDYKAHLEDNSQTGLKDTALYYLGLSYALSPGKDQDLSGAKASLNKILKEYPDSEYKNQAELILGLMSKLEQLNRNMSERDASIKKLRDELDRLKEIDLNRRPSRPAEQ